MVAPCAPIRRFSVAALVAVVMLPLFSLTSADASVGPRAKGAPGHAAIAATHVSSERGVKGGPRGLAASPLMLTARAKGDRNHTSSKPSFRVLGSTLSSADGSLSAATAGTGPIAVRSGSALATAGTTAPTTKFVNTSFPGISDTGWRPPDSTIGAGPLNLVIATNGELDVMPKSGPPATSTQTLVSFFSTLSMANDQVPANDPWVVYDPYISRFWVVAFSGCCSNSNSPQRSTLLIGLSDTSDASGSWSFFQTDATLNGSTNSGYWCDYPHLGFDTQAIYITCNMFSFPINNNQQFQYAKIRVMTKGQFTSGACCYWYDFWGLGEHGSPCGFFGAFCAYGIQPARMYGATDSNGEYLINAHGQGGSDNGVEIFHITSPQNCCNPGNQTSPNLSQVSQGVGSFGSPNGGRQPNSAPIIDTGDTRMLFAIWKGGVLSTGQNLGCNGGTCFGITELNVSSFPTITVVNDAMTGSGSIDRYYPHLDITATGFKTVTFSESSTSQFASAYIADIPAGAACTYCILPEVSIASGQGTYSWANPKNRWGDYSGASQDPDGIDIWLHAEWANTGNAWQTQVASSSPETWVPESPATVPPARQLESMTYDAAHGRVVMFGGTKSSSGALASGALGDTWTWDGSNWTKMNPSTTPGARFGSGMTYDPALGKVVLFGGSNQGNAFLNDTWTWDGSNWAPLFPSTPPPAAPSASLAYDAAAGSVVLYEVPAGQKGNPPLAQTWNFNGTNWNMASVPNPPYRSWPGMTYDRGNGVVVLFGGEQVAKGGAITYLNDTWTWNGSGWTQQSQTGAPSPRALMGMDYDAALGVSVMTSGFNGTLLNDTWWWNGSSWAVQYPASSLSPSRQATAMVFFAKTSLVTLFGGDNSTPAVLSDTWVY
jgi:hypothetical protein